MSRTCMRPRRPFVPARAVLAAGLIWAQAPAWCAADAPTPAATFSAQAAKYDALRKQLDAAQEHKPAACTASELADAALARLSPNQVEAFRTAALQAHTDAARCEAAREQVETLRKQLDDIRADLRAAALTLAPPAATTTSVVAKAAVDDLLKTASEVQQKLDDLRAKTAKVYDVADPATAVAIKLPAYGSLGKQGDPDRDEVVKAAHRAGEAAQNLPGRVKQEVLQAQRAANHLVDHARKLRACLPPTTAVAADEAQYQSCLQLHWGAAQLALAGYNQHTKEATQSWADLELAGRQLAVLDGHKDASWKELKGEVSLRKILDENPNVRSFFGTDAAGVSAGSSGNVATFRYTLQNRRAQNDLLRNTRLTLIGSTPLSDQGLTSVYNTADKLANKTKVSLALQSTRESAHLVKEPDSLGHVLHDYAVGLSVTQDSRKYLVARTPDSDNPLGWADKKGSYYGAGLTADWVLLLDEKSKTLVKLSFERQGAMTDAATIKQCVFSTATSLIDTGKCIEGPNAAPSREWGNLLEFGLRRQFSLLNDKPVNIGLSVKHSLKDHTTDVELPLYFNFAGTQDDPKNPITGGLVLNWSSGSPGLKWGFFVSTPLSFARPERQ